MRDNLLFSYMIDCVKVDVYHLDFPVRSSFINEEFYNSLTAAIAEYLYYPYEIIAPRINSFSIEFAYDNEKLKGSVGITEKYIAECTKEAVLNYMEESCEHANNILPEYVITPDLNDENVSKWCDALKERAEITDVEVQEIESESYGFKWVRFSYEFGIYYGRYRKKENSEYLLVSLPGYNSDWNNLSAYMDGEYDILQLSPLGYNTPYGFDQKKRVRGAWPVLYDTVSEINDNVGYNKWFSEVALAIKAIRSPEQKLIFIGTSQGGGAAIVMSSVFNDCTITCAAEMPFLIGFSDFNYNKVRNFVGSQIGCFGKMIYDFYAKERLLVIDPMKHSKRIKCPTLLLAGECDDECLPQDIAVLYQNLECDKKYIELPKQRHGYTKEFEKYANDWIEKAISSYI